MQIEAERTELPLVVAHYRREQPLFKHIKSLLEQKTIGDVRLVSLQTLQPSVSKLIAKTDENWRTNPAISGGGLFHDLAPHQLDLMIYFFGAPKSTQGISINGAGLYEADDCTAGTILFENNILFNGQWCFTVAEDDSKDLCEIIGSKGKISFKVFQQDAVSVTVNGHVERWNFDKLEHVQQPMIEAVVNYFRGAAPNPCSAADGVAVMELIDAFSKH
jgi:predicted dehydrogenase